MLYFIGTGDNVGERMQAKEYRADIDVLRAIAVLAVIFYHAHIPFFRGGFVGVSIFFVISGYLITGIIKRKLADGTFSFLEFYENRVRRIIVLFFEHARNFRFAAFRPPCAFRFGEFFLLCQYGLFRPRGGNHASFAYMVLGCRGTVLFCFSSAFVYP